MLQRLTRPVRPSGSTAARLAAVAGMREVSVAIGDDASGLTGTAVADGYVVAASGARTAVSACLISFGGVSGVLDGGSEIAGESGWDARRDQVRQLAWAGEGTFAVQPGEV